MEAFAVAEAAVAAEKARLDKQRAVAKGKGQSSSKGKMRAEMDGEDGEASDGLGLGDFKRGLAFDSSDEADDGEDDIKAEEAQDSLDAVALLGSGDGDLVRKILRDDRNAAGTKRRTAKGVRIFDVEKDEEDGRDAMDVDADGHGQGLKLPFSSEELDADPVLSLLRMAVNRHGELSLLRMGDASFRLFFRHFMQVSRTCRHSAREDAVRRFARRMAVRVGYVSMKTVEPPDLYTDSDRLRSYVDIPGPSARPTCI